MVFVDFDILFLGGLLMQVFLYFNFVFITIFGYSYVKLQKSIIDLITCKDKQKLMQWHN